jgi:hypothetical protein
MNCPNPQCKTTGIPDEAMYCPVCGTLLKDTNSDKSGQGEKLSDSELMRFALKEFSSEIDEFKKAFKVATIIIFSIVVIAYLLTSENKSGEFIGFMFCMLYILGALLLLYNILRRVKQDKLLKKYKTKYGIK